MFLFMKFMKKTLAVLVVLAVVAGIAWFRTPGEHFIRVSAVCYGFPLGWFAGWVQHYFSSPRQRGRNAPAA